MSHDAWVRDVIASRARLPRPVVGADRTAEGGCGVVGLACGEPVAGRHLLRSLTQIRNRGNGKGGGIAAVGLDPAQLGVSPEVLRSHTLLALAYLDPTIRGRVEREVIEANYQIAHVHEWEVNPGSVYDVRPPDVVVYFVQPDEARLAAFAEEHRLGPITPRVRDEFVFQTSYRLNAEFYAGPSGNQAFVLSHGRDLLVLKMVGYAEEVIHHYRLEDFRAHVWIGHHRYPTKGRVWHPGGAHPFIGLNEALVHNGDFANYASISEYLAQRGLRTQFQTDTEVAALVFDLHRRTYGYRLEHVIESLAPTTERDFTLLSTQRQHVYRALQTTHIHGSPDGPWFFIIASSDDAGWHLIGITDTSMLRPQVFAIQDGPAPIALVASEKQAIDAVLESLSAEDPRFWSRPDRLWMARGGSHDDGGAFAFTVAPDPETGGHSLRCSDKYGTPVGAREDREPTDAIRHDLPLPQPAPDAPLPGLEEVAGWTWEDAHAFAAQAEAMAGIPARRAEVIAALTRLIDRRMDTGALRPSSLRCVMDDALERVFAVIRAAPCQRYRFLEEGPTPAPPDAEATLLIDARMHEVDGPSSLALRVCQLVSAGWRRLLIFRARGHRFLGNGLGPNSQGVTLDIYGSPGDYLASGIDGATLIVHANGQDQLGQILKSGELVVHGDIGQTFMYGAKGGQAFILGNAGGRPLINAVGKPRVVINGTCLDYLAESFMAGDPLQGGGFAIVNGLSWDGRSRWVDLPIPYPGGNLMSLASGGAIYVRDPRGRISVNQLNGGEFVEMSAADWALVEPMLQRNEALFGITLDRLLTSGGQRLDPLKVYRKVRPAKTKVLQAEEAWVAHAKKGAAAPR